ncbi:hypothetical protein KIN20_030247 [Parelaphostrongylus tenuis]|uniref:Uncharacterized protein n=1 Tax=Parelaphostrongylus tenuis TaxID=148309 RepID=A0AAD5R3F5_PARTN|nr:hypothetical protein KIN20_030247 [Parelaphostrongylus tenuis]
MRYEGANSEQLLTSDFSKGDKPKKDISTFFWKGNPEAGNECRMKNISLRERLLELIGLI